MRIIRERNVFFGIRPITQLHLCFRDKNYMLKEHIHNYYHIIYVVEGSFILHLESKLVRVKSGEVAIIPPHCKHGISTDEKSRQFSVDLEVYEDEKGIYQLFFQSFRSEVIIFKYSNAVLQFEQTYNLMGIITPINLAVMYNIAEGLVLDIIKKYNNGEHDGFIKKFTDLFDIQDAMSYTLTDLCMKMNMSRTQLERIVYEEFGCGVIEYKNRIRIVRACAMLDNFNDIQTTSEQLCFYDSSHFIHFFKNRMGITPLQYTKKKVLVLPKEKSNE